MSDPKKMSIDEILAACRQGSASAEPQPKPAAASPPAASEEGKPAGGPPASPATPPKKAGEMSVTPDQSLGTSATEATPPKKAGEMSVSEILAAARGTATSTPANTAAPESKGVKSQPAAPAKDASKMSVADILAAARGEKSAPAAPAAPATRPTASKSAEAAVQAKAGPASSAKAAGTGTETRAQTRETSSILVAARSGAKPGPMTKEQAAKLASTSPPAARIVVPAIPEKPAYARPKPEPAAPVGEPRRTFLRIFFGSFLAVGFTSLAAVTGLWTLGLARFMFPNILTEPPSRFKVGVTADFAPETVSTNFTSQYGVWIVNTVYEGQRQIVALKTVCTHLGCTPNWLESERKFKCPCHGSGFYIDGINFEGPAPRPLERYAIHLADDGQLEVDKSRKFQQEMGQWNNSASFVSV